MNKKILIPVVVIIALLIVTYSLRDFISEKRFMTKAERLADKIPPEHKEHYEKEFYYAINKFWECYEKKVVSENDLIDVLDYIDDLNRKEQVSREEIFDFLGYVSRIYTTAIRKNQERKQTGGSG